MEETLKVVKHMTDVRLFRRSDEMIESAAPTEEREENMWGVI